MPHKIESGIGDTRYDILSKFTELFYNYQTYYDVNGNFIFGEKPAYQSNGKVVNDITKNKDVNSKTSNDDTLLIKKDLLTAITKWDEAVDKLHKAYNEIYKNLKNKYNIQFYN